jgi:hypothetical protein
MSCGIELGFILADLAILLLATRAKGGVCAMTTTRS